MCSRKYTKHDFLDFFFIPFLYFHWRSSVSIKFIFENYCDFPVTVGTFIAGYLTNRNLPGYKLLEDHGYSGGPVGFAKAFAYVIQVGTHW